MAYPSIRHLLKIRLIVNSLVFSWLSSSWRGCSPFQPRRWTTGVLVVVVVSGGVVVVIVVAVG